MKSVENLKEQLVNGEISMNDLGLLLDYYTIKGRGLFWDIRSAMRVGEYGRADRLQEKLDELDKDEADLYQFVVYFLEFKKNGE